MKKLLLFYFTLLLIRTSFSQASQAYHSYDDYAEQIIDINGFKFVSSYLQTNVFIDSAFILGYSPNGQQKFRYRINLIEVPHINSMTITQDTCLLAVGNYAGTCDVYNTIGGFILKLDTNGIERFFQYSSPVNSPYDNINVVAINHPSWKNIVYSRDRIDAYNEFGNLTFSEPGIAMSIVHSAISTVYDSIIYISHSEITTNNDTIHYLSANEPPGYPTNITQVNFSLKKILKNSQNFLYGLTHKGKIIKFNTDLDTIASTNTTQNNLTLSDFDIKQDTLYACARNSLSIVKFDGDLNLIYQHNETYPGINYSGLSVSQNSISIIGRETPTTQTLHPNYFIAKTDLNGGLSLVNDTYIEDFSISSYSVNISYPPAPSDPVAYFYFKLLVKLYNNSTDTLHSVYLNCLPNSYINDVCGRTYYHQLIQNLHIPPFSSQYIETQTITDYKSYAFGPTANDSLTNTNYCIWASAPNFQGDANHANDVFCGRLSIPVITGLNESNSNNNISISPNPTAGNFYINFVSKTDRKKYSLKITSMFEEVVFNSELNNNENEIDISLLSSGVYILSVYDNENKIVFKKIVKQ